MVGAMFEELDYQMTSMGELILRRRRSVSMRDTIVYEVKLDGAFLMSSLVRRSEEALAQIPLSGRNEDHELAVLVGGLGLGHTAAAALGYSTVARVDVVESLAPVINWHKQQLVPAADTLMDDPRCSLIEADFFALIDGREQGLVGAYDAILVDIDHSPDSVLESGHDAFYTEPGMKQLSRWLNPGGAFGLWSADQPGQTFVQAVENVFSTTNLHPVTFTNPNFSQKEQNWILFAEATESAAPGS
jgi:spermidine synthase